MTRRQRRGPRAGPGSYPDLFGLRIGSLFSGYGGIDLAVREVLGGDVVWHSDIKVAAVRLLAQRFPGTPNLGDLSTVDFREVTPVDVLTFGWPCQPHSSAGKRLGADDPRALWPVVARGVGACRPAVLVGENVARVASNGELRRVVRSLAALGYVGAWRCAAASDLVGAPHKRDRLVLVAVDAHAEPDRLARVVNSAATAAPGWGNVGELLPTPCARDWKSPGRPGREWLPGQPLSTTVHRIPYAAGEPASRWGVYTGAVARWEAVLGRTAPAPTQPNTRNRSPQLSPRFVEWMMGLPKGHVSDTVNLSERGTPASERNAMLSLLGDGVVVPYIAAQVRALLPIALAEVAPETVSA